MKLSEEALKNIEIFESRRPALCIQIQGLITETEKLGISIGERVELAKEFVWQSCSPDNNVFFLEPATTEACEASNFKSTLICEKLNEFLEPTNEEKYNIFPLSFSELMAFENYQTWSLTEKGENPFEEIGYSFIRKGNVFLEVKMEPSEFLKANLTQDKLVNYKLILNELGLSLETKDKIFVPMLKITVVALGASMEPINVNFLLVNEEKVQVFSPLISKPESMRSDQIIWHEITLNLEIIYNLKQSHGIKVIGFKGKPETKKTVFSITVENKNVELIIDEFLDTLRKINLNN